MMIYDVIFGWLNYQIVYLIRWPIATTVQHGRFILGMAVSLQITSIPKNQGIQIDPKHTILTFFLRHKKNNIVSSKLPEKEHKQQIHTKT